MGYTAVQDKNLCEKYVVPQVPSKESRVVIMDAALMIQGITALSAVVATQLLGAWCGVTMVRRTTLRYDPMKAAAARHRAQLAAEQEPEPLAVTAVLPAVDIAAWSAPAVSSVVSAPEHTAPKMLEPAPVLLAIEAASSRTVVSDIAAGIEGIENIETAVRCNHATSVSSCCTSAIVAPDHAQSLISS